MGQLFERALRREDGVIYTTNIEQSQGKRKKLCGDIVTILAGTVQNIDIKFSNISDFDIKGGSYYAKDGVIGDYLSLFAIDKDNVLGYGLNFIPPTGNFTEPIYTDGVLQTTGKVMVIPNGYYFIGSDTQTSSIPKGVYLRMIYLNLLSIKQESFGIMI